MPSWTKALTVLAGRNKIDSAAIFDLNGNLLSKTENFAEKQEHIEAVIRVLRTSSPQVLLKLSVFGEVFTCLGPAQTGMLLATSQDRLFVAALTSNSVVIAFSNEEHPGSCLYEVTEFSKMIEHKLTR